jgi:N-acetylglucosamine kinase-like BadF-type ATPase
VRELVLAIDGGGVKTDLALLETSGRLLALVRGGRSSPHYVGVEGCVSLLGDLLGRARSESGVDGHPVATAQIMVAGADLPEEIDALRRELDRLDWADELVVDNDTYAMLRSGTDRGWGVAVVCGAGINCVGVSPDGHQVRFPSLGLITGDWGGGYDVGLAALAAAARSADGRGPRTLLQTAVPAHFGMREPLDLARALHLRRLPGERLGELARVVFPVAAEDEVAATIVRRLTDEVVAFAAAALRRLELTAADPDVVLGGGLMRAAPPSAIAEISSGVRSVAPGANVLVAPSAPIVGAALLGFDALRATSAIAARARVALDAAFRDLEGDGSMVLVEERHG